VLTLLTCNARWNHSPVTPAALSQRQIGMRPVDFPLANGYNFLLMQEVSRMGSQGLSDCTVPEIANVQPVD